MLQSCKSLDPLEVEENQGLKIKQKMEFIF